MSEEDTPRLAQHHDSLIFTRGRIAVGTGGTGRRCSSKAATIVEQPLSAGFIASSSPTVESATTLAYRDMSAPLRRGGREP